MVSGFREKLLWFEGLGLGCGKTISGHKSSIIPQPRRPCVTTVLVKHDLAEETPCTTVIALQMLQVLQLLDANLHTSLRS